MRECLTSVNALAREVEPLVDSVDTVEALRVTAAREPPESKGPPKGCRSGSSSHPTRRSNGPSPLSRKRPHAPAGSDWRQRLCRRLVRTPRRQFGRLLHPDRTEPPPRLPRRHPRVTELVFDRAQDQPSLERHGGHPPASSAASRAPRQRHPPHCTAARSGADSPRATTQGSNRLRSTGGERLASRL